jgi:arylsulfatase
MKMKTKLAALSLALGAVIASTTRAQEVLPRPEQPSGGKMGRTTKESTKDFPEEVHAPKGAPNILVILTNDVGLAGSNSRPLGGNT